jgi:hypothetical protein
MVGRPFLRFEHLHTRCLAFRFCCRTPSLAQTGRVGVGKRPHKRGEVWLIRLWVSGLQDIFCGDFAGEKPWRVLENSVFRGQWGPLQDDVDHRQLNHGAAVGGQSFVVGTQATELQQPPVYAAVNNTPPATFRPTCFMVTMARAFPKASPRGHFRADLLVWRPVRLAAQ